MKKTCEQSSSNNHLPMSEYGRWETQAGDWTVSTTRIKGIEHPLVVAQSAHGKKGLLLTFVSLSKKLSSQSKGCFATTHGKRTALQPCGGAAADHSRALRCPSSARRASHSSRPAHTRPGGLSTPARRT